ncbi:MAG: excinuclease ABC subunit UvrA [Verrucomicrobiae bacterium]|nr:excinuclease ABC subunit UvrA [Verrucomicrobiae bacterium]
MGSEAENTTIKLRGVRQNNLKGFDLDLPLNKLIVITGPSGSGKSSLAFETIYAEGQRRYIETFSPYARQFFDRMDKPRVDSVECIPPAIAIEQRNSVKTTRSTVGTMTEICDYMKVLMPTISILHCKKCNSPVKRESPQDVWEKVLEFSKNLKFKDEMLDTLIVFSLPLSEKLSLKDSLKLVTKQGYQRLLIDNAVVRIEEIEKNLVNKKSPSTKQSESENISVDGHPFSVHTHSIIVVQDRVRLTADSRTRFIDACEQAYHYGKGVLSIFWKLESDKSNLWTNPPLRFSNKLHCAECDISYDEPSPSIFSYNNPIGACPTCHGFGRSIVIDWDAVIPDKMLSIRQGVIYPWQRGYSRECYYELMEMCEKRGIPVDVPFCKLPEDVQKWIIRGDPDYGIDDEHNYPQAWYGVEGYFEYLERKTYKMHVRVFLSRYRKYVPCADCRGGRLKPESLLYKLPLDENLAARFSTEGKCKGNAINLAEFYLLPIEDAFCVIKSIWQKYKTDRKSPIHHALEEVHTRLNYLVEIGLGYLNLNRASRTLSGGESERVNLTTCLGTHLVNTLYILDEPSIGLHPRDTDRLIKILKDLRDIGNTVVVVEHDPEVIESADYIVDLGPGSGEHGGNIVFQGPYPDLLKDEKSLTAQYLSRKRVIQPPQRKPVRIITDGIIHWQCPVLKVFNATKHNLKNLNVEIPLERFVCITGVSGSGKSTLVKECIAPALSYWLNRKDNSYIFDSGSEDKEDSDESNNTSDSELVPGVELDGYEHIDHVEIVDQSPPGKTPRSNPAIYLRAFDYIRELFAELTSHLSPHNTFARIFSFNTKEGRCEHCEGMGYEKIEMQFLSDVYIKCPKCNGRRYNQSALEIKIAPDQDKIKKSSKLYEKYLKNIADVLDCSIDEAVEWLKLFKPRKNLEKGIKILEVLQNLGLGYLKLGQPLTTLSGGECQRLKLAKAISKISLKTPDVENKKQLNNHGYGIPRILFVFDEPTTGLHLNDINVLIKVFHQLVDSGHTVLVIEHNLEVIKCADWIIDLGPEAGERGGKIVFCGPPEEIVNCAQSYTGIALRSTMNM